MNFYENCGAKNVKNVATYEQICNINKFLNKIFFSINEIEKFYRQIKNMFLNNIGEVSIDIHLYK